MLVVIANDLPPVVRGRMKLWFIEPRPNVFISSVKDATANNVIDYLYKYCSPKSGLLILKSTFSSPGFIICGMGDAINRFTEISGLQLIVEKTKDNHSK